MAYTGEQIEPARVLSEIEKTATAEGFSARPLFEVENHAVSAFTRKAITKEGPSIYLSAGVHGDEPAPPMALLKLFQSQKLSDKVNWTVVPLVNPTGLAQNTRENAEGIDLNRDFKAPKSVEARSLCAFLEHQNPFTLSLLLHEDWESKGFYLYALPLPGSDAIAEAIISSVSEEIPIDRDESIDGMEASHGIIRPDPSDLDRDPKLQGEWPEAFFIYHRELARLQFTLEAPSAFPLEKRVKAIEAAIEAAVQSIIAET